MARVVGPWEGDAAIDLYGGVGLFALSLARRYRAVTLVEGDRGAVRYARKNARLAHAARARICERFDSRRTTIALRELFAAQLRRAQELRT